MATDPVEMAYLGSTTGKERSEIDRRERVANDLVTADVDYLTVDEGPLSVESGVEEAWAAAALCPLVDDHADAYDAFVVGCFGEPGVRPLRELVDAPVVGTAAPALHTAAQLSTRFSVLTILDSTVPTTREQVRELGLDGSLASVRAVDAPVLSVDHDSAALVDRMRAVGRAAVEEDGAEALVPGCASLSFVQAHGGLTEDLGVPFLDPVRVALATAELWARHGVTHSRAAYPSAPREKLDGLLGTN
jgi:allantoin racemase